MCGDETNPAVAPADANCGACAPDTAPEAVTPEVTPSEEVTSPATETPVSE